MQSSNELLRRALHATPEEKARQKAAYDLAWLNHNEALAKEGPILHMIGMTGLSRSDLESKTFEMFKITPETQKIVERLQTWHPSHNHGYILHGTYGTGKTHLVKAVQIKLAKEGIKSMFLTVADMMHLLRVDIENKASITEAAYTKLVLAEVLVLDDLGAEKTTDWVQERFLSLLNDRLARNRPLLITSNLSGQAFKERYGARTADRFLEMMVFLPIEGPSRRLDIYQSRLKRLTKTLFGAKE